MVLPAPDLDDRRFQDFVDDAKRLVQQRCPEWSDHNVSDPGITLLEAYAQMVDSLVYRLNRVPERHYLKFLELIGVRLRPPAAARGPVTFWLSAPQPQTVLVRAETEVATARTDVEDAVVFGTEEDLRIIPCSRAHAGRATAGGDIADQTAALDFGRGFACFSDQPVPGDALLVGLSTAVPSCAVVLRVDCPVAGMGVDPRRPPVRWEAWTGTGWAPCEVDSDGTGGFNKPGDVVLHVPREHQTSVLATVRAGWLRCRVVQAEPDQPGYRASPLLRGISAFTIGGTVGMLHAQAVHDEEIGVSDGTPAQRFPLLRAPVVPGEGPARLRVRAAADGSEQEWAEVDTFAASTATDRHFRIDAHLGEVEFGPAVREADGSLREYGAVPGKGGRLRLATYRTGGGRRGNVARGQVRVLKTSVPYVARVENRGPAVGGAEAETVENAKLRGPLLLRTRGRAVTREDFEELTREVAPDAARVCCVPADESGGVRLLVVPHLSGDEVGRVRRTDLDPAEPMLRRIAGYLDARRLVGTRLVVEPPEYVWLTAVVDVSARRGEQTEQVRTEVLRAVYRLFDPLTGGPDGTGWPLGRAVQAHEVHAALARVPGVDLSREVSVQLFPADPETRRRSAAVQRLELSPTGLVYSFDHQARVRA